MKLLLSITIASLYGISLRLLFASFGDAMAIMSNTFFFIVPFLIGYLTILFLPYREKHTSTGAFFKPSLTCLAILGITIFFRMEGVICWVMAFPIFAILAGFGGLFAFKRKRRRAFKKFEWDFEKDDKEKTGKLNISLLFFIPLFAGLVEGNHTSTFENLTVEKQIVISASPNVVWSALTAPHQATGQSRHRTLCSLLGFPRHLTTNLDIVAVGGRRIATYEKGLTFLETISQLEPNRRLEVSITTDPSKISKAIMDEHIVIGGEHIRMQADTYTLQPLPDCKTRLSLVSRFSINTPFNWYASLWAKWLMSDVLNEELLSLRNSTVASLAPEAVALF